MGYTINRYNGTVLTVVEDGTVNTVTEVKFVGKNFSGYGEVQNENFLHLMENFSSSVPPSKPLSGMIWYDNTDSKIKFYDGNKWRLAGSAEVSTTQPTGASEGDFWWNSSTNQLFAKNANNEWVLIGPQTTEFGETLLQSRTIQGIDSVTGQKRSYAIIESVISDQNSSRTVFIISNETFLIDDDPSLENNEILGFTLIRKGITFADVDEDGITIENKSDTTKPVFWGTASNALLLNGKSTDQFLLKSENQVDVDGKLEINQQFSFFTDQENGVIENEPDGSSIVFKIAGEGIVRINQTGLIPEVDNKFNIGSAALQPNKPPVDTLQTLQDLPELQNTVGDIRNVISEGEPYKWNGSIWENVGDRRWKEVHAVNFKGTADRANELKAGSGNYVKARIDPIPNTVAARTSAQEIINGQPIAAGALKATFFVGRATTAQYADLAEKYTTEKEWPVGTAMAVCDHSDHETCPANADNVAIGVISADPAYLMNSECNGQAIGLKGRVPVRVIGVVRKGDPIYAFENGVCSTLKTISLVGVALETSLDENEKLVECVLKV